MPQALDLVFGNIKEAAFFSKDATVLWVNPAFCKVMSKDDEPPKVASDFVGKTYAELNPPEDARKYAKDDAGIVAAGDADAFVEGNVASGGQVQTVKIPTNDGILCIFWKKK